MFATERILRSQILCFAHAVCFTTSSHEVRAVGKSATNNKSERKSDGAFFEPGKYSLLIFNKINKEV